MNLWPALGRDAHDPVQVAAAPAHVLAASPAPKKLDRTLVDFVPNDYGNMTDPICTCESLANCGRAVAFLNGFDLTVAADAPKGNYAGVLGIPNTETAIQATQGARMLDVARWQDRNGFDVGTQRLAMRYGSLSLGRSTLANGMARLGPLWLGGKLRERDMDNALSAVPWDVQDGRDDGAVVGGHAFFAWMYAGLADGDLVAVGTWARWKMVTWAWLAARLDEVWGVIFRQLARADGSFYAGLTADGLMTELSG